MKSIQVGEASANAWGDTVVLEPRFASMIGRLEALAASSPRSHRYRVVAAGMLGYVVLASVLLLIIGLVVGIIAILISHPGGAAGGIKFIIPLGAVIVSIISAMRVEWPQADGIVIDKADAPDLHQMIDGIRHSTRGPHVHEVRITGDMNAAITQFPRLLFLPCRNILFLGLPLLQALTPQEVEAVVAHEMGHFVGAHGRTSAFIYHIRARWSQLGQRLPAGIVAGGLRRFFGWYGPWFAAYSFVLARRQEYEADALAARVVGAANMGSALIRIACQSEHWNKGWSQIWSQAAERPDPPVSPYAMLGEMMLVEPEGAASEALTRVVACDCDLDDTHPSLSQRLAALRISPEIPKPFSKSAATVFLGPALVGILEKLDAIWHSAADECWAEDFNDRRQLHSERQMLEARAASEHLDYEDRHRLAQLVEVIDGPQQGAEAYAAVLTEFPEAHGSRFRYGDALLDTGDEAGIASLLEAARGEPALLIAALDRIVRYGYDTQNDELVERFRPQLDAEAAAKQELDKASSAIDETVVLRPLDPATREELAQLTSHVAGVKWLYAGERDLANGRQIVFVFAAQRNFSGREVLDTLLDEMLPVGDLIGIEHCRNRRWLTNRLKSLETAIIRH